MIGLCHKFFDLGEPFTRAYAFLIVIPAKAGTQYRCQKLLQQRSKPGFVESLRRLLISSRDTV
jgi:hypothetical protein